MFHLFMTEVSNYLELGIISDYASISILDTENT